LAGIRFFKTQKMIRRLFSISIFLLIALFSNTKLSAQLNHHFINSSVYIELSDSIGNISYGTGFIYLDANQAYLITAKHVIISKIKNFKPKNLLIQTYKDQNFDTVSHDISFDFEKLARDKLIIFHPKYDVVAINIGSFENKVISYKHLNSGKKSATIRGIVRSNLRKYSEVNIGNDVYVIGYPKAYGLRYIKDQFDYRKAMLRKGIIAQKFNKNKSIIIDCPVYLGYSGCPVFEISETEKYIVTKLIGIIIEYIPYESDTSIPNLKYLNNSGFSVVLPIDYLIELFK
ncbi:MAG: serine protease, partial [Bacteroidales bacterium]|nr:serine protease [Bacteroidales bacterium]